jgi:hypothetical protein
MGAPVRIGDVMAEKYRVTRILGSGRADSLVAASFHATDIATTTEQHN